MLGTSSSTWAVSTRRMSESDNKNVSRDEGELGKVLVDKESLTGLHVCAKL